MTPERVKEITWNFEINIYDDDEFPKIERAIRQAVNEALSEVESSILAKMKPFTMGGIIEREQALHIVRTLKLPEES